VFVLKDSGRGRAVHSYRVWWWLTLCVPFRLLPVPGSALFTARTTAAVCSRLMVPPKDDRLERMDFDGEGTVAGTVPPRI